MLRKWVDLQGGLSFNPSNITAVSLSSTFFNYAPCLIQNAAAGAAFTAVGLNIVPQVRPLKQHSTTVACLRAAAASGTLLRCWPPLMHVPAPS